MKINNDQIEKTGIHKYMIRVNKFIRPSLFVFAILLYNPSFSQVAGNSENNGSVDASLAYSNSVAVNSHDAGNVITVATDYRDEQTAYPYPGDEKHQYDQSDHYASFSIGMGELFHKSMDEPMQVSFPYTSTDASGKTTNSLFISTPIRPFTPSQLTSMLLNLEIGRPSKYFVDMNFNFMKNMFSSSIGYGRQIDMGNKEFFIKPSINLTVEMSTENGDDLGNIDNINKTVDLLGYTSDPTFVIPKGKHTPEMDENTQYMEVDYDQTSFAITPQIGISNNQYEHRFHWEFDIGYNLAISEEGGVDLMQYGQSASRCLSPNPIYFGSNNLTAISNNKIYTSDPNKFSSFYMNFSLGYNSNGHSNHCNHKGCC
jgi:hypothetical protein